MRKLPPVHPGSVLLAEFMDPLGLDEPALAKGLGIRPTALRALLAHKGSVAAELALRLARYFGTTPEFWLNLQQSFDLAIAQDELGTRIADQVSPLRLDR